MTAERNFLSSDRVLSWLGQFGIGDQATAQRILERMLLVSADEFTDELTQLLKKRINIDKRPVGLYAEREIRKWKGEPNRLFKESKTKVKRAYGAGPQPVQPTKAYDRQVGSEGLVAHIITELCKKNSHICFSHPGPDKIRTEEIRRFIVVSDFLGSGRRAQLYLQSAWRLASVKSWRSYNLMKFEVVAHSATERGTHEVSAHPSEPVVSFVKSCPTIHSVFDSDLQEAIKHLCINYDPVDRNPTESLGYSGVGALIAFAHGVPNNAPRIFHKSSRIWAPLFPFRITADLRRQFGQSQNRKTIERRLTQMRQSRLAKVAAQLGRSPDSSAMILVLTALKMKLRKNEGISELTGLSILEIEQKIGRAVENGWVSKTRHLTDNGRSVLDQAKKCHTQADFTEEKTPEFYYPSMLRAPIKVSS